MYIDLLLQKLLQAIKKKKKWYEQNAFAIIFTEGYISLVLQLLLSKYSESKV